MTQAMQQPRGRLRRLDALDKVTGRARYTSDLALPRMLHGVIVRSDRPHARLLAVDITSAQAVPDIRVITPPLGGGCGAKLEASVEMYAAVLARKARRPVKIVNTREEDLAFGNPRHPMRIQIKSAVDRDGNLSGREARIIMDAGAYGTASPVLTGVAANLAPGPYRIPNVRLEVVAVYTNKVPFSAYRGPTGPQTVFAVESHTDALARRLGVDPLAFRLKHVFQEGDVAHNGQTLTGAGTGESRAIHRRVLLDRGGDAERHGQ